MLTDVLCEPVRSLSFIYIRIRVVCARARSYLFNRSSNWIEQVHIYGETRETREIIERERTSTYMKREDISIRKKKKIYLIEKRIENV
jgi:hypothetical protein